MILFSAIIADIFFTSNRKNEGMDTFHYSIRSQVENTCQRTSYMK